MATTTTTQRAAAAGAASETQSVGKEPVSYVILAIRYIILI